ncbi:pentatricopeptide repeat-containing protein [Cucumis melo var. makuwa]|uniref:Pentatricopeptide repeat-containing protein n=1 Tax=Cucumis melo var. makuwa TaxID=1194695 RepID=A0A5D3DJ38_CUCMM|nr:pentatricopeptide repeat-containing protein [Cucumis melo var. makuwa]TYK23390.1 pentatricopeptide repeat-containing protein [Cucumis melo var. makuwa]
MSNLVMVRRRIWSTKTFHAAALTVFNAQQHFRRRPVLFNIAFQFKQTCFSSSKANSFQVPEFYSLDKKISYLIRTGRINEARALFDSIKHWNTITWNRMITAYVKRREMLKARQLFDEMPNRDIVSWNLMLSGYISCGGKFIERARNMFDEMPESDCVSWNTMLSGYAKSGMMDKAEELFNDMPERNVVSWNAMVSGYLMNGYVEKAIEFFKLMPKRDSASLRALVSGLIQNDKLVEAERILFQYGGNDGKGDLVDAYNTLIAGYGQKGMAYEARKLFDHIPSLCIQEEDDCGNSRRNVISWNSMIMCYVRAGDIVSARELFDKMVERDTFSWNTMISGYVQILDMKEASNLFSRMPEPDTLSWNMMISGFSEIGSLELARDLFKKIPEKSLVSWNSMISGYEKNEDYKGAMNIFLQMQLEGKKPDRHTLSSILSACAGLVDLALGTQIHQLVTKAFIADLPINNSLVTMYSRCGAIVEARMVFDEMNLQRDVISWNAMIGGYASHGFATEALQLFGLMKQCNVQPSYITFISVLNACAHAGLVEDGRREFNSMVNSHGIKPQVEHYAALVDIIGRHGQLEEALSLINSMPCEPDKAVWGALLGACRVHNNVEMARAAAEALMKLQPESSAPYVLLHNMYADVGRWDDAAEIRTMMEKNNVLKYAGYSRVDSYC